MIQSGLLYPLNRLCDPGLDYTVTLILALVLTIKYILYDSVEVDRGLSKRSSSQSIVSSLDLPEGEEPVTQAESNVTKWQQPKEGVCHSHWKEHESFSAPVRLYT